MGWSLKTSNTKVVFIFNSLSIYNHYTKYRLHIAIVKF